MLDSLAGPGPGRLRDFEAEVARHHTRTELTCTLLDALSQTRSASSCTIRPFRWEELVPPGSSCGTASRAYMALGAGR